VDALFVGPRDLSHALGIPGQVDLPQFQEALDRVLEAAASAGVAAGILAGTDESARKYAEQGFTLIGIGSDSSFIAFAARVAANALDGGLDVSADDHRAAQHGSTTT
jgi:2-dehydro-3-deoxyglucarate aldolase/4-hydroxy-2-oxoheptanedioate aldolase